jgi:hypothetical protein
MRKISQARRAAGQRNGELNAHRDRNQNRLIAMEAADLYGGTIDPLMPANLTFEMVFGALWGRKKGARQYKQARELSTSSDFFGATIYLKEIFFNDGFSFGEDKNTKLKKWLREQGYDFARIVNDAWQEWLTCDNVVAFWQQREKQSDGLPIVTILDCEICDYKNAFGFETLTLQLPKVNFSAEELSRMSAKGLDKRYLDAIKDGKKLVLDESNGERFKVLTRAKLGKGLAPPRVGLVLQQLSVMELFGIGDWAAASMMKKVMRQFQKGHEIKAGPLAGQPTHFLKVKEAKQILNAQKNKDGAYDSVTNFDMNTKFPFIDPRYFDAKKFEGTLARLERWAGPVGRILLAGQSQSPYLMDAFETEGKRQRRLIGDFLAAIFRDESFVGNNPPPVDLVPRWNQRSFTPAKMLIEMGRFLYSDGLLSGPTAREWFELDDKEEGDLQEKAAKKRQRYTPPFEAKQGMVAGSTKGGRPVESPTGIAQE